MSKYEAAYEKANKWLAVELSITKLKALSYKQDNVQAMKDEVKVLRELVKELE